MRWATSSRRDKISTLPRREDAIGGGGLAPTIRCKADSYWVILYENGYGDEVV